MVEATYKHTVKHSETNFRIGDPLCVTEKKSKCVTRLCHNLSKLDLMCRYQISCSMPHTRQMTFTNTTRSLLGISKFWPLWHRQNMSSTSNLIIFSSKDIRMLVNCSKGEDPWYLDLGPWQGWGCVKMSQPKQVKHQGLQMISDWPSHDKFLKQCKAWICSLWPWASQTQVSMSKSFLIYKMVTTNSTEVVCKIT